MTDSYCTGKQVLWWDFFRWGIWIKNKRKQREEGNKRFTDSMWDQNYPEGGKN